MSSERAWFEGWIGACVGAVLSAMAGCGSSPSAAARSHDGASDMHAAPVAAGQADQSAAAKSATTTAPQSMSSGSSAGAGAARAGASGQTGSAAAPAAEPSMPTKPASDPQMPAVDAHGPWPDLRGGCPQLKSGFPGDEACIAPPAVGEGIQIHVGPSDYSDPQQINQFVLHPGQEVAECWSYHTPNTEDIDYQGWTISGRPGTHHIFNSMLTVEVSDGGGFHVCVDSGLGNSPNRLGSLPGAAKPYMPRTVVAPENEGVGAPLKANTPSEADMHYFNATSKDILREFWMNLYFIPKEKVTQQTIELRGMGGIGWTVLPIQPGTDQVYQYECPISAAGRVLTMIGHYHAHGKRLTAHVRHASGSRDKIFEMYDYKNAAIFPFDSVSTNPPLMDGIDGAVSGMLDVVAGDVLEWECHVINDSSVALGYTNSVQEGEMCNVFGTTVGSEISCLLP